MSGPSVVPVDMIPPAPQAATPSEEPQTAAVEPVPSIPSDPVSEPAEETPSVAAEVAAKPETGPQAGSGGGGNLILVRARTNSWIQVRDDIAGELLLTRLLRAGDSYAVPDRPGLKLSTGNAGALEILVGGEPVPSIGSEGTVLRGVALDAEKLRAGTAVAE